MRSCCSLSWRWALVLGWCSVVVVCSPPLPAESASGQQSVTVSLATLREWTESLQRADAYLTQAESRLADSQSSLTALSATLAQAERRLSQLSARLTLWREHSAELETSLQDSAATLVRLRETLLALTERYDRLSRAFSDYRAEAERQIADRERSVRVWRAVGLGAVMLAVLGWIVAAI